jgi:hypothetical protein
MYLYNYPKYFNLSIEHGDDVNENVLTLTDESGDYNSSCSIELSDDEIDELIAGANLFATQLKILKS